MKRFVLAATAAMTLSSAAFADGFVYHGATFDKEGWYNTPGGFMNSTARATVQFDFKGTDFFVQPEISVDNYNFATFGATVGGHVGRYISPDLAVGGFGVYSGTFPGFTGGNFAVGPEAKGTFGDYNWEAYGAAFFNSGGIYGGTVRADAWRPVNDRFTLGAGFGLVNNGGPTTFQGTLRGCYDLGNNFELEGSYTYSGWSGGSNHGVGLKITYKVDKGTEFGSRSPIRLNMGF